MKIEMVVLLDGYWTSIETDRPFKFRCTVKDEQSHGFCTTPIVESFKKSGKECEEGVIHCKDGDCPATMPYHIIVAD